MTLTRRPTKIAFAALAFATSAALMTGLWSIAEHAASSAPSVVAAATQPASNPVLRAAASHAGEVLIGLATQNAATVLL